MKILNKLLKGLLVLVLTFGFFSCNDDDFSAKEVSISDLSVASAFPNDPVSFSGINLETVQFLFVGEQQAEFQLNGDVVSFIVPERAVVGQNSITLAMANGYRVKVPFEVLLRPTPVINSISPSAAEPGENITIIGTSLHNLQKVSVNDIEATVVSSSESELVFTIPEGPQNNALAIIKIVTSGGSTESDSVFYVGENLVLNGELEEGTGDDFTNWSKFNGGDGLIASDKPYAGRSLKVIAAGGDAWRTQFVSDPTEISVGVDYTAFMWIKAEEAGGNIRFSTNSTTGALYSGDYDIGTEWQQIEWTFTNNDPATRLVLDMGVSAGMVYHVDNITIVSTLSGPPPPPNLLLNGDLELGGADDFTNWGEWNAPDLLTVETTETHGGSRALKAIGVGGDAWRTQFASDAVTTEVGQTYIASMWIKGEGAGDGGNVRFSTSATAGALYGPDFAITGEWQQVSWEFEANDVAINLVLDLGFVQDAIYYVDDISFSETPPPPPNENILLNPGLEEGDGDDFTNWGKWNAPDLLTATTVADEVHGGSRALKAIGVGGDAWRTQFASDPAATTENGVNYIASMWIKAEAGSPGDGGTVRFSTSATAGAQYGPDFTVTTEWQEYTWTFAANDVATNLVLDVGFVQDAVYFIDDITLTEEN
ncbi:Carbohydrate binding domain-containing protein [Flaviramulus basaltis]|uniref:Carbohydrate binding domain-containing protein n=1 Tax=Flaviramulus basaltis TaxID=369401 RepID=A0A1K2IIF3_9FLAO|nr:carbohydrate binding domain-containing protein [Flaviramulus basaltis]SFZ92050.1 Carbohydrate binding domain-containing protein [Flaviramulus basaltis]